MADNVKLVILQQGTQEKGKQHFVCIDASTTSYHQSSKQHLYSEHHRDKCYAFTHVKLSHRSKKQDRRITGVFKEFYKIEQ